MSALVVVGRISQKRSCVLCMPKVDRVDGRSVTLRDGVCSVPLCQVRSRRKSDSMMVPFTLNKGQLLRSNGDPS